MPRFHKAARAAGIRPIVGAGDPIALEGREGREGRVEPGGAGWAGGQVERQGRPAAGRTGVDRRSTARAGVSSPSGSSTHRPTRAIQPTRPTRPTCPPVFPTDPTQVFTLPLLCKRRGAPRTLSAHHAHESWPPQGAKALPLPFACLDGMTGGLVAVVGRVPPRCPALRCRRSPRSHRRAVRARGRSWNPAAAPAAR